MGTPIFLTEIEIQRPRRQGLIENENTRLRPYVNGDEKTTDLTASLCPWGTAGGSGYGRIWRVFCVDHGHVGVRSYRMLQDTATKFPDTGSSPNHVTDRVFRSVVEVRRSIFGRLH